MRTLPSTGHAARAVALVEDLQRQLVERLQQAAATVGDEQPLQPVEWLRDGGRHGGGVRYVTGDTEAFDRASVNVSAVHYDDLPDKALASANALSTIVHPSPPRAPSMHMHISWTEMRDGRGYWRVMADLNPSIPVDADRDAFTAALQGAAGALYEGAAEQGDRYFAIPALDRHRGVTHFYLEGHNSGDFAADEALARSVGEAVIATYGGILDEALGREVRREDRAVQLAYHTLYLFQVLTLDRGTTSGLMVHDDNDVGIMGSLPSHVDRDLLASWRARVPEPQGELVDRLVSALSAASPSPVDEDAKRALAQSVRAHYRAHPEALKLQARGHVVPPTVQNHRG